MSSLSPQTAAASPLFSGVFVCECFSLTAEDIRQKIMSQHLRHPDDLHDSLDAYCCGHCRSALTALFQATLPKATLPEPHSQPHSQSPTAIPHAPCLP